jgi:hypothetical protein
MSAVLDESQTEVEGSAAFINQDSTNTIAAQGTALFHISPSFQLGPHVEYVAVFTDGGDVSAFVVGAEARYNLDTEGDILPFVGGSLNLVRVSFDDGFDDEFGIAYTLNGGIRVPVSPGAFMVTKLQFTAVSIDDVDTDNFGVFAGYAVRF